MPRCFPSWCLYVIQVEHTPKCPFYHADLSNVCLITLSWAYSKMSSFLKLNMLRNVLPEWVFRSMHTLREDAAWGTKQLCCSLACCREQTSLAVIPWSLPVLVSCSPSCETTVLSYLLCLRFMLNELISVLSAKKMNGYVRWWVCWFASLWFLF